MDHTTTCKKTSREPAPHGMGRALAPVGALPPYLPRGFYFPIPYIERTHAIEKRERRTHHITHHATLTQHDATPLPANPANPKTWYGGGIERVRSGSRLHPSGIFLDERNPARN